MKMIIALALAGMLLCQQSKHGGSYSVTVVESNTTYRAKLSVVENSIRITRDGKAEIIIPADRIRVISYYDDDEQIELIWEPHGWQPGTAESRLVLHCSNQRLLTALERASGVAITPVNGLVMHESGNGEIVRIP